MARYQRLLAFLLVIPFLCIPDMAAWWNYVVENDFPVDDPLSRRTYGDGPEDRPRSFAIRNAMPEEEKAEEITTGFLTPHG